MVIVQILSTKLYIPSRRSKIISRPRLIKRINEGIYSKLTLISASAGTGKTTLVSQWISDCTRPVAWLSLDEGDNDITRFLSHLLASLQKIEEKIGAKLIQVLRSPQRPSIEAILTSLINDMMSISDDFVLVLDDYHVITNKEVNTALTFLLEHMPTHMHLVITTRMDPDIPLARLRARGQLNEIRFNDLRFTAFEAAEFLNQIMELNLSMEEITALEKRTEGWFVGLQLAAISMKGREDVTDFIETINGSHHFVQDYLIEEVLQQQPECIQKFLIYTSILDRICGSLCEAGLNKEGKQKKNVGEYTSSSMLSNERISGQRALEYLEQNNIFIVPLDNERRWYRYHHLFAESLRQRLRQKMNVSKGDEGSGIAELHRRASQWYEKNGLEIEALHHAAAANDVDRAAGIIEGNGFPLHFRGGVTPVLNWLKTLPSTVLHTSSSLCVIYASALLMVGEMNGVELKLQAADKALQDYESEENEKVRDLIGHIAAIRATLAVSQHYVERIHNQSLRALKYLSPHNLPVRTSTIWTLGYAHQLQGDHTAAKKAYTEAIAISEAIGHHIITISASIGLGNIQEANNELFIAAKTYQYVLQLVGDPPLPVACEAHLGLARISLEWNDIVAAQHHVQQSIQLAKQLVYTDRVIASEVFLARLKLVKGEITDSSAILTKADKEAHQHNYTYQIPEITALQVLISLNQGKLTKAAKLAKKSDCPLSQARVHLVQEDTSTALELLESVRLQIEKKGWENEKLKIMVLQAITLYKHGQKEQAIQWLKEALSLAEPGGFIRIFVAEGASMAHLLSEIVTQDIMSEYINKLLTAIKREKQKGDNTTTTVLCVRTVVVVSSL